MDGYALALKACQMMNLETPRESRQEIKESRSALSALIRKRRHDQDMTVESVDHWAKVTQGSCELIERCQYVPLERTLKILELFDNAEVIEHPYTEQPLRFQIRWGSLREEVEAVDPASLQTRVDAALLLLHTRHGDSAEQSLPAQLYCEMLLPDFFSGWRLHWQAIGPAHHQQSDFRKWIAETGMELFDLIRRKQQIPQGVQDRR